MDLIISHCQTEFQKYTHSFKMVSNFETLDVKCIKFAFLFRNTRNENSDMLSSCLKKEEQVFEDNIQLKTTLSHSFLINS